MLDPQWSARKPEEGVGREREGGNEEELACGMTQMTVPGIVLCEIRQP